VRAYNSQNAIIAEADGGYWSFTTQSLPGSFNKLAPANNSTNVLATGVQLSWGASTNPAPEHYEYCLDTVSNTRCDTQWVTASSPVTLTSLNVNTIYYWQVRAVNGSGSTLANDGNWWQFTTQISPNIFNKLWPPDAATNQPANSVGLSWMISPNALRYQYCISTTNNACSSTWISVGTATSTTVTTPLNYATQYYWQVEAVYSNDTTSADAGAWWRFTTQDAPPAAFMKTSPGNDSTNLYTDVTFTWQASAGATSYEFCLSDMNNDTTCGDAPWDFVSGTTYTVFGLDVGATYYWQVRAINGTATTESNTGTWCAFQTQPNPPQAFHKTTPADGTVGAATTLNLVWNPTASTGVTYQVCSDTTNAAICDMNAWQTVPSGTAYTLANLARGVRYYWQVRATNGGGTTYADGDQAAWWSFTTLPDAPVSSNLTIYGQPEDASVSDTLQGADTAGWSFTLYGSQPSGILDLQSNGHFIYTPVPNSFDPVSFQFRVTDTINPPAGPYTVTINYVPVNDAPVLNLITVPDSVLSALPINFTASATDVDLGDQLTFTGLNLPAGASLVSTTGDFNWTPIYSKAGSNSYTFTITVSDGSLIDSQQITVIVLPQLIYLPIVVR